MIHFHIWVDCPFNLDRIFFSVVMIETGTVTVESLPVTCCFANMFYSFCH